MCSVVSRPSAAADASGMTASRHRPKPLTWRSTATVTRTLPSAPRPERPGLAALLDQAWGGFTPAMSVSSTSTSPTNRSRPGYTMALRYRCNIAHAVW